MKKAMQAQVRQVTVNELFETCRRRLPYETCGVIVGAEDSGGISVDGFVVVRNAAANPERSFSFDPEDWVRVCYETKINQQRIVGVFHSHPNRPPAPSDWDKRGAEPWGTYWIVGINREHAELRVYYWFDDNTLQPALLTVIP